MKYFIFSFLLFPFLGNALYFPINEDLPLSITRYRSANPEEHDMLALQQISLNILKKGIRSKDDTAVLMAIFGCGASLHQEATTLLQQATEYPSPSHQLAALTLLARQLDESTSEACLHALGSYYLPVRLEAIHLLCQIGVPGTFEHLESLMMKLPEEIHPLFIQLYALLGDKPSIEYIRRAFHSPNLETRLSATLYSAATGHDELLPEIRSLANQTHPLQQEVCAFAIGALHDRSSMERLEQICNSSVANTRTAALIALHNLGNGEATQKLISQALDGDIFSISFLSDLVDSKPHLLALSQSKDTQIATNAAIGLGKQGDPLSVPLLTPLFLSDDRDLALVPISSGSGALKAWKVIPSARQNMKHDPMSYEMALRLQEQLVQILSQSLPEETFLQLAEEILVHGKGNLIPTVIHSLEILRTENAVALLSRYQHKFGDPLTRHYCELALTRLKINGPHHQRLIDWLLKESKEEMISLRPAIPWERHRTSSVQELCPAERSALLIETFETLASKQSQEGINVLLEAMEKGHSHNRYALAGLLMRAAS